MAIDQVTALGIMRSLSDSCGKAVRSNPQSRVSLTERVRFAGYRALRNCVGAIPFVRRNT